MRTIEIAESVTIARPVEPVFAFLSDRTRDHLWWSGVMGSPLFDCSAGFQGVGSSCIHETRLLGQVVATRIEVTGYDPPRTLVIESGTGLTPFTAWCTFECAPGGGTILTLRARLRAAEIFRRMKPLLIIPAMKRQVRGNFRRLKELLETNADRALGQYEAARSPRSPYALPERNPTSRRRLTT